MTDILVMDFRMEVGSYIAYSLAYQGLGSGRMCQKSLSNDLR